MLWNTMQNFNSEHCLRRAYQKSLHESLCLGLSEANTVGFSLPSSTRESESSARQRLPEDSRGSQVLYIELHPYPPPSFLYWSPLSVMLVLTHLLPLLRTLLCLLWSLLYHEAVMTGTAFQNTYRSLSYEPCRVMKQWRQGRSSAILPAQHQMINVTPYMNVSRSLLRERCREYLFQSLPCRWFIVRNSNQCFLKSICDLS